MSIVYTNAITAEACNALRKSVGWKEPPREQAEIGLSNSIVFVAEQNGTPIGMTRIVTDGGTIAIIVDVIVHPDHQGQGIGKALVEKAIDHLKGTLPAGWFVNISLMAAKGKEGFYEQFGFVKRPSERYGNGMSLWCENQGETQ